MAVKKRIRKIQIENKKYWKFILFYLKYCVCGVYVLVWTPFWHSRHLSNQWKNFIEKIWKSAIFDSRFLAENFSCHFFGSVFELNGDDLSKEPGKSKKYEEICSIFLRVDFTRILFVLVRTEWNLQGCVWGTAKLHLYY